MKNIRCWDCKYLGVCELASGQKRECEHFLLYHYGKDKTLTESDFEKITGLSKRTLYRHLQKAKELMDLIEEKTGSRFALKKLKSDNLYHLIEVEDYED